MDYQVDQVKTEPQESEEYPKQLCMEKYQNSNSNNQENVSKVNPYQHHVYIQSKSEQSQNDGVYNPNLMSSLPSKLKIKREFICDSMNQTIEHINICNQPTTALDNITNYNYNKLSCDEVIKTETDILDLNSREVIHHPSQEFNIETTSTATPIVKQPSSPKNILKSKKNSCIVCEKSFTTSSYLKKHFNTIMHKNAVKKSSLLDPENHPNGTQNQEEKPHKCDRCLRQFSKERYLKGHLCLHNGKRPFSCNLCSKTFAKNSNLTRHKIIHEETKPHKCNQCSKQFNQKWSLVKHMYVHAGKKPFSCSLCGKGFVTNGAMNKHIKGIHEGKKPFSCSVCGSGFMTENALKQHKNIHKVEKPYKCDQCLKQFNQKYHLTQHMHIHTGKKPFSCNVCGEGYITKSNLKLHQTIHEGEKPHKCEMCLKLFGNKSNLLRHMYIHTRKKPFSCNYCEKGFMTITDMTNHNTINRAEKSYKCDQCPKEFNHNCHLMQHILYFHIKKKPFNCNLCGKGFMTKFVMSKHKNLHKAEKPYKCNQCSQQFSCKWNLTRHMYLHSENKPYSCSICGKGFIRRFRLIKHEILHKGELRKTRIKRKYNQQLLKDEANV